ncbi:MAG: peptidylprolyl isomerase [Bacteroidales bacterium]|nr:peptidylprolyl isomerase [Bacteroidales bacterium]
MKKHLLKIFIITILFSQTGFAQNNEEIILTINDKKITKAEFERIYKKNNNIANSEIDKKSVQEYLDLFINFKLKVFEAESFGLDTSKAFINELNGYRKQLEKPYLTDNKVNDRLMQEAYERTQYDIKAKHILIKITKDASPKDTIEVYNKIVEIRNEILNGESFESMAKKYSDDPSAKNNGGNLGYFTAFQMVYSFETAAYNTNIGDISMPVRTKFGYHIIKVIDKRKAQGQIKVAHIMIAVPKGITTEDEQKAKEKIFLIADSLKAGKDFSEMAKLYSDDKGSAKKGGVLPMFGTGRMVEEFEKAAFALSNINDISEPVKTAFGWHLIKLIDKKEIGTFDKLKAEIKTKILKDTRSQKSKEAIIIKLKNEYNFTEYPKRLAEFYNVVDDSYFKAEWDPAKAKNLNKTIFTLLDKKYNQQEFTQFLNKIQNKRKPVEIKEIVDKNYNRFVRISIIRFEKARLETKYPEFKYLMQEYHDGILLFELTDKMVWSKAVQDTTGLLEFHEKNKDKYMWGERYECSIYFCENEKTLKKVQKLIDNRSTKPISDDEMLNTINKGGKELLKINTGVFSKGDNELIDHTFWGIGSFDKIEKETNFIAFSGKKVAPCPKTLQEAKGLITADYQTYLEKEWIKELRNKYKITINKEVLDSIN